METQTRFDLNTAIENWRAELAAQSDLTTEMRRELETHLQDSIASLRQRGLNDEEAFWVARKRVGKPGQLGEEFIKADPASVWRERVFWMALAGLLIWLWQGTSSMIAVIVTNLIRRSLYSMVGGWGMHTHPYVEFGMDMIGIMLQILPVCWLAYYLAIRRTDKSPQWFSVIRSPARLMTIACVWTLFAFAVMIWSAYGWHRMEIQMQAQAAIHGSGTTVSVSVVRNLISGLCFPFTLLVLLVWLRPAHFRLRPKTA